MNQQTITEQPSLIKEKMPKKNKIRMWVGISLLIVYATIFIIFVFIPKKIIEINHFRVGSLGNWGDSPALEQMIFEGYMILALTFIPLALTGLVFTIYNILEWKKVKHPNIITIFILLLIILLPILLLLLLSIIMQHTPTTSI